MTLGFYLGHVLEIGAVALVGIPAALDLAPRRRLAPARRRPDRDRAVACEEAYLGPRVRALMVRLERRDVSTEEHTRRVALLAARVGEELKLSATVAPPPRRRRPAARHRQALRAARDPQQARRADRRGVRRDQAPPGRRPPAARGARRLPARPSAASVSDHHERLDGTGYPRGLNAARPCASRRASSRSATSTTRWCPTACTARRGPPSARSASSHEESGTRYDPKVVAALERIVTRPCARRRSRPAARSAAARPAPPGRAPPDRHTVQPDGSDHGPHT